jgi:hypothetical protein
MQVKIDRQLASDLGVRVSDVASAVRLLMSGDDEISTYKEGGEQYPVTMRLMPGQRDDQQVLSRLLVPSARLGLIRLDSIARSSAAPGPSRIDRFARQYGIGVSTATWPRATRSAPRRPRCRRYSIRDEPAAGYRLLFSGPGPDPGGDHGEHGAGDRAGLDLHVHGAGGAVRVARPPVHHSFDAAACRFPSRCSACISPGGR